MTIKIPIKDIDSNPFRNTEHYKISELKVERLIQSFQTTSFWPVIIGRKAAKKTHGVEATRIQIAFGHTRIEAATRLYGKNHEIEIIIMNLSDEDMLKMMANENQQDFATPFIVEMETVQAVVQAFADGKIELNSPGLSGRGLRCAPEFIQVPDPRTKFDPGSSSRSLLEGRKFYNAMTVAEFLGWTDGDKSAAKGRRAQPRVEDSLSALQFIEEGYLKLSQLENLNRADCARVVHETNKERKERLSELKESEDYLKKIEADLEEVEGTPKEEEVKQRVRIAKTEVNKAKEKAKTEPAAAAKAVVDHANEKKRDKEAAEAAKAATDRVPKDLPDVSGAADKLRGQIERSISAQDEIGQKLEALSRDRGHIVEGSRRLLISALERLSKRAQGYADKFKLPEQRLAKETTRRLLTK